MTCTTTCFFPFLLFSSPLDLSLFLSFFVFSFLNLFPQLLQDYTAETYAKFMQGADTFEDEDEMYLAKISKHWKLTWLHNLNWSELPIWHCHNIWPMVQNTVFFFVCVHRKAVQCGWGHSSLEGREVQGTERWGGASGDREPNGQWHFKFAHW